MKISKAQKQMNRNRLIECAASLFVSAGYRNTTMKDVAQAAKLSEPSIYKYFPTKENLIYGYFELRLNQLLSSFLNQKSVDKMNFPEKFQLLIEMQLELFETEKSFIAETFQSVFVSPVPGLNLELSKIRLDFISFIRSQWELSQRRAEGSPNSTLESFFIEWFWDYYIGILYYWIHDDTPAHQRTTELIDRSMGLIAEVFKTELLTKISGMIQFLIRQHLFDGINSLLKMGLGDHRGENKK